MKKIVISLSLIGSLFAGSALADDAQIQSALRTIGVDSTNAKITDSPIAGFKSVLTTQGIFYVSADGSYISQGPIYNLKSGSPENIANATMAALVNSIAKDAIVYKSPDEKYVISVFTDITCSYCKKLHEQIPEYNLLGITVRYFAFPRQGVNSSVGKDMQSIWSTADRKTALNNAYKGNKVSPANSMVPYVANHYQVGRQLGITGTPAIILSDGELISGYIPPADLLNALNERFGQ